jgi:hypothetical protein
MSHLPLLKARLGSVSRGTKVSTICQKRGSQARIHGHLTRAEGVSSHLSSGFARSASASASCPVLSLTSRRFVWIMLRCRLSPLTGASPRPFRYGRWTGIQGQIFEMVKRAKGTRSMSTVSLDLDAALTATACSSINSSGTGNNVRGSSSHIDKATDTPRVKFTGAFHPASNPLIRGVPAIFGTEYWG